MNVSYHHANPFTTNESFLLKFDDETTYNQTACVLVDAGPNVDVGKLLDEDEYLTAIVLTHAHSDHYLSLAANLRDGAPIYTSEATASILETVLGEAAQHATGGLGDTDAVIDALEPIDDWTSPVSNLQIAPVPVGHTPGAVGFLLQFDTDTDDDSEETRTILATGDWTRQRAAGYPGIDTALPVNLGAVFLTGTTNDSYEGALTESVRTICERAYAGSTVLVSASGLTSVRYAYLVGHLAEEVERPLSVTLVGQAAKLYDDLDYDVPNVEAVPEFDDPNALLEPGGVTIAGPEVPTEGSSGHLFGAIRNNPSATLVQVVAGDGTPVSPAQCTTYDFETIGHPTEDTVDAIVEEFDPTQVIITHQRGQNARRYKDKYNSFVWATDDMDRYTIYEDGEWVGPPWMTAEGVAYIHRGNGSERNTWLGAGFNDSGDEKIPLPSCDRFDEDVDLVAEGLDIPVLERQLRVVGTPMNETSRPTKTTGAAEATGASGPDGGMNGMTPTMDDDSTPEEDVSATETLPARSVASITARLDAIESQLNGTTLRAQVVDAGTDITLLRVLGDFDAKHGQTVEITIRETDDRNVSPK